MPKTKMTLSRDDCQRIRVSDVRFAAASDADASTGIIGYVECVLNSVVRLDHLVVRRTLDDRRVISFPARTDSAGRRRFIVRPVDDRCRREIEQQILSQLGIEEDTSR